MKILIAHNRYQQAGGEDHAVDNEIRLLEKNGHEIVRFEKTNDSITGMKSRVLAAAQVAYSPGSYHEALALIQKNRPDRVHVHNFFPLITPAIFQAAADAGVPTIFTLHNYRLFCANALLLRDQKPCELCLGHSALPGLKHCCYRNSFLGSASLVGMIEWHKQKRTWDRLVSRFIALSEFSKAKFIAGGLPKDKISVKPNFAFHPESMRRSEGGPYLCVSRLSEEKGIRTLIEAWREVSAPLVLIGDGPLRAWVEAQALPQVQVRGAVSSQAVSEAMQQSRALVLPSECYENFPLVVAEAYANGLPVLASRTGALGEIVLPGKTGLHFAPNDPKSLREAVASFSAVSNLSDYQGHCLSVFKRLYSEESNYRQLMEIYENAKLAI